MLRFLPPQTAPRRWDNRSQPCKSKWSLEHHYFVIWVPNKFVIFETCLLHPICWALHLDAAMHHLARLAGLCLVARHVVPFMAIVDGQTRFVQLLWKVRGFYWFYCSWCFLNRRFCATVYHKPFAKRRAVIQAQMKTQS